MTLGGAVSVFNSLYHPLISTFTRYDYRHSRCFRLSLLLGQMSLITILVILAFAKTGEAVNEEKSNWVNMLVLSLILSLFTLPLPSGCCKCFEKKLYRFKDSLDTSNPQLGGTLNMPDSNA